MLELLCGHEPASLPLDDSRLAAISDCVATLAPKARLAVELRYRKSLKPPEISQAMGWTVNAVNVALSRARRAIRHCVEARLALNPS